MEKKNKKTKTFLIHDIIAKREQILKIAKECGVKNIRIFGSVSRGQETKRSDIDFLVDLEDKNTAGHVDFAIKIGEFLKKKRVDVCIEEELHKNFKEKVLKNAVSIMEDNPKIDPTQKDARDYYANLDIAFRSINNYYEKAKAGKEEFKKNRTMQNDLRAEVQIAIEEIVRKVPYEIKAWSPKTPWGELRRFRNFIVHNYEVAFHVTIWDAYQKNIKLLEEGCKIILTKLDKKSK